MATALLGSQMLITTYATSRSRSTASARLLAKVLKRTTQEVRYAWVHEQLSLRSHLPADHIPVWLASSSEQRYPPLETGIPNVDHRIHNQQISLNSLSKTPSQGVEENHSGGALCVCAWATFSKVAPTCRPYPCMARLIIWTEISSSWERPALASTFLSHCRSLRPQDQVRWKLEDQLWTKKRCAIQS